MTTREESMLRQVVANRFGGVTSLEEFFVIDATLPAAVARQIATPADVAAALDCWRDLMHAAVDDVYLRQMRQLNWPK